jgi:hypothetical protein
VMGSPCSMGIASPCFRRLSRYPRMASLAIARASFRVSPSVTRPGSAGTVTAYPLLGRLKDHRVAVLGVWQLGSSRVHRLSPTYTPSGGTSRREGRSNLWARFDLPSQRLGSAHLLGTLLYLD